MPLTRGTLESLNQGCTAHKAAAEEGLRAANMRDACGNLANHALIVVVIVVVVLVEFAPKRITSSHGLLR